MEINDKLINNLADLVRKVRYKPNAEIFLYFGKDNLLRFKTVMRVRNSENSNNKYYEDDISSYGNYSIASDKIRNDRTELIDIVSDSIIPSWALKSERSFLRFIYESILDIEVHELREWLRIDGEPFIGVHGEKGVLD